MTSYAYRCLVTPLLVAATTTTPLAAAFWMIRPQRQQGCIQQPQDGLPQLLLPLQQDGPLQQPRFKVSRHLQSWAFSASSSSSSSFVSTNKPENEYNNNKSTVPAASKTETNKEPNLVKEPPPPQIPPPHLFEDPVDLSVVVSWVEDTFSKKWGTLEHDVKPLFYEFGMGYTQVAVCVSETQQKIYVTFRGTDIMEFPDVLANLNIFWDTYGPTNKPAIGLMRTTTTPKESKHDDTAPTIDIAGKVQRGWNRKVFNPHLYIPLSEKILQTKERYPNYGVVIAGHSLGAALSILYGAYVAKYVLPDETVNVINLGAPRVGDETFYRALQDISNLTIWRLVFRDDIVARCPPMWLGYRHVGHMLHWDHDDRVKAYHTQLESCMDSKCYAGIQPNKWNLFSGVLKHHEHSNYKCIVEQAKKNPETYWPKGFETLQKEK